MKENQFVIVTKLAYCNAKGCKYRYDAEFNRDSDGLPYCAFKTISMDDEGKCEDFEKE